MIEKLGRTLESPSDFEYLSEQIQKATGEYLSPTTLKRLFGYIPQDGTPRKGTLSIVARYAGYAGWQDYTSKQQVESDFVAGERVDSRDLSVGAKVRLAWMPDRECVVEHLGDSAFLVLSSANAKLRIGDRFRASHFIVGQPLTATDVVTVRARDNEELNVYVAGAKSGLTAVEVM